MCRHRVESTRATDYNTHVAHTYFALIARTRQPVDSCVWGTTMLHTYFQSQREKHTHRSTVTTSTRATMRPNTYQQRRASWIVLQKQEDTENCLSRTCARRFSGRTCRSRRCRSQSTGAQKQRRHATARATCESMFLRNAQHDMLTNTCTTHHDNAYYWARRQDHALSAQADFGI